MELIVSQEAIAPSAVSLFAAELTAIFKDAFTARDTFANNKKEVVENTIKYFKKHLHKRMLDVVKKHTGLTINTLSYSKQPDFDIHCRLQCFNDATLIHVMSRMNANEAPPQWIIDLYKESGEVKDIATLEALSRKLNSETGKIDLRNIKFDSKRETLDCDINLDLYTLLLIPEVMHSKLDRMTAPECAAIMMHEIGHQLTMLEMAKYMWHITRINIAGFKNFQTKATISEKQQFLMQHKDTIKNNKTGNTDIDALAEKYTDGTVDNILEKAKKEKDGDTPKWYHYLTATFSYGLTLVAMVGIVPVVITRFIGMTIFDMLFLPFMIKTSDWNIKLSDLDKNMKQVSTVEQLADQYVSQHGMGIHIGAGLNKLTKAMRVGQTTNPILRQSKIFMTMIDSFMTILLASVNYADEEWYTGYETDANQVQRLIDNNIAALKHPGLPDGHKKMYVDQINGLQQIKKDIAGKNNGVITKTAVTIIKIINRITISAFVNQVFDTNFANQYSDLVSKMERFDNNPLYYRSAQLATQQK